MFGPLAVVCDIILWGIVSGVWYCGYRNWRHAGHSRFFPICVLLSMFLLVQVGHGVQLPVILVMMCLLFLFVRFRRNGRTSALATVLFTSFVAAFIWNVAIHQVMYYWRLKYLDAHDVQAISVREKMLTSREDCGRVVAALNGSTWFVGNIGDSGDEFPIVIRFHSGEAWAFSLAICHDTNGAIVFCGLFDNGKRVANFGELFCPDLPDAILK
jgi:hypothetical protein